MFSKCHSVNVIFIKQTNANENRYWCWVPFFTFFHLIKKLIPDQVEVFSIMLVLGQFSYTSNYFFNIKYNSNLQTNTNLNWIVSSSRRNVQQGHQGDGGWSARASFEVQHVSRNVRTSRTLPTKPLDRSRISPPSRILVQVINHSNK
jgi:hypothetical protein